ncbi:MAG: peptide deformylase [bacterium]|nr:peptide deformylase [bacterium]
MILPIEKGENNEFLRKKSLLIESVDLPAGRQGEKILDLAKDMIQTMIRNNGVGLAACQIGMNVRMFVINEDLTKKQIFINPEIFKMSKKTEICDEGCLSFPNLFKKIPRAKSLKIKAIDENGKEFKLKAKGLFARAIQHEMEHLDGILLVDHDQN